MTDAVAFRAQFPVLEEKSYLKRGHRGPAPRAAADAARAELDRELAGGPLRPGLLRGAEGLAQQTRARLRVGARRAPGGGRADRLDDRWRQHDHRRARPAPRRRDRHQRTRSTPGCWRRWRAPAHCTAWTIKVVPFAELAAGVSASTAARPPAPTSRGERPGARRRGAEGNRCLRPARRRPGDRRGAGRRQGARLRLLRGSRPEVAVWAEGSGCLYVNPERLDDLTVPWPSYASLLDAAQALTSPPAEGVARLGPWLPARAAERLGARVDAGLRRRRLGLGPRACRDLGSAPSPTGLPGAV